MLWLVIGILLLFIGIFALIDLLNYNKCPKCKKRTLEEYISFRDSTIYKCSNCGNKLMRG